ncbi:MAG TPA: choice-of-anchor tandem repeat GloVer-containing protein [Candidatus Binatia bacterium]|nr:choice-of-anchor tandem repeat GloVer-containing protein [Candidatus Binatia bacterium]
MKIQSRRIAGAAALALFVFVFAMFVVLCGAAQAQTFTVLHTFTGQGDGGTPLGTPLLDARGNIYGTTYYNGSTGWGTVYKLGPAGDGWVLTTLYTFGTGGPTDGQNPYGNVVRDPSGVLYGAAWEGGTYNFGTVFSLRPSPNAYPVSVLSPMWATWLHSFNYWDGQYPFFGDLTMDSQGNLYGTTTDGGSYGQGTVYKLSPSNGGWTFQTLYNFAPMGTVGAFPMSGVTLDAAGNLYGTTTKGGTANAGVVYKVTPSGDGTVLYNFTGGDDGSFPMAGVIFDASGNLYGATSVDGTAGGGAVFKLSPGEDGWTYNLIYPITGWGYESELGTGIWRNLLMDPAGNLYGVTCPIETGHYSTVFELTPGANGWSYTPLYTFTNGADGSLSEGGLVRDSLGNLYGVASFGGVYNYGLVFEITPGGRAPASRPSPER